MGSRVGWISRLIVLSRIQVFAISSQCSSEAGSKWQHPFQVPIQIWHCLEERRATVSSYGSSWEGRTFPRSFSGGFLPLTIHPWGLGHKPIPKSVTSMVFLVLLRLNKFWGITVAYHTFVWWLQLTRCFVHPPSNISLMQVRQVLLLPFYIQDDGGL